MARELFIDASAWVALTETDDKHHEEAKKAYTRALQDFQKFVTTNLVIAESHAILRRDLGHAASIQFLGGIETSLRIVYVFSGDELEMQAKEILRKYKDQDFSYADAVSFAVMKQRGIKEVFTYDQHFRAMGFQMVG
jgi:predicted nucleic acid-binding protein